MKLVYINMTFLQGKSLIKVSKKYFKVTDFEDAAVADFATFAGGKYLYVPPASVETVSQRDAVTEFEDRAVGFPNRNIHRVAAVKHSASCGNVYAARRL